MAAEGQSDRMVSDMEVPMKQRCGIEFLHAEKLASIDNSSVLAKCLWSPIGEHSEAVGGVFQQ